MACFDALASGYDLFMWPLERALLARLRQRAFSALCPSTFPRLVLEVGVGTGANLPFYPASSRVVAVDASADMLAVARRRRTRAMVQLSQTDVQHLAFPNATFDGVVGSFLLCNVANPLAVLQEVRRVLRPGGWLLLLEHVRGAHPWVARLTDLLDLPWHAWNRSCHLNRETETTVASAGFTITRSERYALGVVQLIKAVPIVDTTPSTASGDALSSVLRTGSQQAKIDLYLSPHVPHLVPSKPVLEDKLPTLRLCSGQACPTSYSGQRANPNPRLNKTTASKPSAR